MCLSSHSTEGICLTCYSYPQFHPLCEPETGQSALVCQQSVTQVFLSSVLGSCPLHAAWTGREHLSFGLHVNFSLLVPGPPATERPCQTLSGSQKEAMAVQMLRRRNTGSSCQNTCMLLKQAFHTGTQNYNTLQF